VQIRKKWNHKTTPYPTNLRRWKCNHNQSMRQLGRTPKHTDSHGYGCGGLTVAIGQ